MISFPFCYWYKFDVTEIGGSSGIWTELNWSDLIWFDMIWSDLKQDKKQSNNIKKQNKSKQVKGHFLLTLFIYWNQQAKRKMPFNAEEFMSQPTVEEFEVLKKDELLA